MDYDDYGRLLGAKYHQLYIV